MKFLSDILAKAGLTVDGVVTLNNTATGQTPDANDNSTKLATTAWVRTFVQPYSLPIASASVLGGIKVGAGLSINPSTGVLSASAAGISTRDVCTFTATAGQTIFSCSYTVDQVDVFYNGSKLGASEFTASNGTTVVLNTACKVGDNLEIVSWVAGAGLSSSRTITINGVTYDLTANRTWTTLPTGGAAGDILAKVDGTDYNTTWIPNFTSTVQHTVKAGVALTKGQAVYVSSADGTNMIVSKASNASEQTSSKTLGLVAQNLAINGQGFVVTEGLLAGLNTNGANAGDPVWLGTDGNLIFGLLNKPTAPAHLVFIGVVTRVQQNNGEIFVKVQNGFELDELHDLSVKNASDGDMIKYVASTGLWTKIAASTTNIVEGTNLYYTTARANTDFDTRLATKSTSNLSEGTNLYYTDTRVGTYLTNNSYATQTYVNTAVSNLVDAAPGTLDTLNELAAALGDDPNFATTVATSIGTKVPNTRTITINGTAYDLSADRSWTINSMVYPGAGIAVSTGSAWGTSITNNSTNWNTAYGWGNHASAGYLTGITSSQVTTALGFTPYNNTNPSGYISSYTETDTLASVTARGASTSTRTTFTEVGATREGSDSVAVGPWFRWTNVAESRQMLTQLNASFGLTTWAYNGSAWLSAMTLTQGGVLSTSASINAGDSITLQGELYFGSANSNRYFRLVKSGTAESAGVLNYQFYTGSSWVTKSTLNNSGNVTYAGTLTTSGTITSNGGAAHSIAATSSQRYIIQALNTSNSINSGYGWWWFHNANGDMGFHADGVGDILNITRGGGATINGNTILTAGNYSSYSLPLSGGTMSGTPIFTAAWSNAGGDYTGITNPAYKVDVTSGYWRVVYKGAHSSVSGVYNFETGKNVYWGEPTDTGDYIFRGRTMKWAASNGSEYVLLHANNYNSYSPTLTGVGASGTWSITATGNVASRGQSNWNDSTVINNVVGMLAWKNYGNGHVIFDASQGTSPSGGGVSQTNATNAWVATYPTLMGWNGSQTYGVRVDSARVADSSGSASSVAWTGVSAGRRTNYDLEFQPAVNNYAGFAFFGTNSSNAGYFLIRGGADNDIYTENGITLVADQGWLTLAQRTASSRGVRIMTGSSTSTTRVSITDSYSTFSNGIKFAGSTNNAYLSSGDWGFRVTNDNGYIQFGPANNSWSHIYSDKSFYFNQELYVNNQQVIHSGNIGSQSVSNATTVGSVGIGNIVRKDTTGQYLRAYYQYGSYLTSETPQNLVDQGIQGGGLRVDFMHPSYTGSGGWNHVITWSGYNGYNMYQLGGHYDGGTGTDLWVRSEANHGLSSWTSWRRLLNSSNYSSYALPLSGGTMSGPIRRSGHASTFFEGSYNNVGGNSDKTNPIYTIGSAYNPSDSSLGSMYGIGYAHPNLWGSGKTNGWGMYVCSAGVIDVTIGGDGGSTSIWAKTDIVAYSDARVKENVEVIENALEKVQAIRGVTFTRNDVKDKTKRSTGVIAQEVLTVLPEVVSGTEEDMYSVAYGNMAGLFIEAIKELKAENDALKETLKRNNII